MRLNITLPKILLVAVLILLGLSEASGVSAGYYGWTSSGPPGPILSLTVDPQTPTTLYAGTSGGGVFKTTNGGASWTATNIGLNDSYIGALAIDPQTPSTLYAGTWHDVAASGTGGVYKSTNGGASWSAIINGIDTDITVQALAIDPQTPTIIYAGSGDYARHGSVFKSTDGGASWSVVDSGPTSGIFYAVTVNPLTPSTLYTVGTNCLYHNCHGFLKKSTDGGASWSGIGSSIGVRYAYALAIDPQTPSTLYTGTDGGGGVQE